MTFDLYSYRFTFSARDRIDFPAGAPGNIVRGALGSALRKIACVPDCPGHAGRDVRLCGRRLDCAYARIFEPAGEGIGPSGLSDWPRPFVLRAAHLDGQAVMPGQCFLVNVNLFEMRYPVLDLFERAFRDLAAEGIGPGRGRAELVSVEQLDREGHATAGFPISIALERGRPEICKIRVEFLTPTELKSDRGLQFSTRIAVLSLFGMMNWIYTWYKPRVDADAASIAREMGDLLLRGVMTGAKVRKERAGLDKSSSTQGLRSN